MADFSLPAQGDDPRWAAVRASNAERDQVVAQLQQHFVEGRLDHEELTARIDQVWASTTRGELQRVLYDLPATSGIPTQPAPTPKGNVRKGVRKIGLRERTGLSTTQLVLLAIAAIILVPLLARLLSEIAPIIVIGVIVWLFMRNRARRT